MSQPVQPQPAAPAPGGGFQFPISQLPPVSAPTQGTQQPAQPAVPQPGQPGFNQPPAHLAQPRAAVQPAFVPNLGAQQQPGQGTQQAPQPSAAELSMVLQGDHLPPQIRGRTVGDVIAQHTMMVQAIRQQGGAPAQPQPQHVPTQTSMQPAPQPGATPAAEFFRDPHAAIRASLAGERQETVNAVLAALAPVLGPVVQSTMQNQSAVAMQTVMAELGPDRFRQLSPYMQQYLAASPQNTWGNAETWRLAAKAAIGDLVMAGKQLVAPQQPSQAFGTPASPFPVQQVGPNGQPLPGAASFFTESPSQVQQGNNRVQLTATQRHVFEQMRAHDPQTWSSEDVYMAWLGGVQPTRR